MRCERRGWLVKKLDCQTAAPFPLTYRKGRPGAPRGPGKRPQQFFFQSHCAHLSRLAISIVIVLLKVRRYRDTGIRQQTNAVILTEISMDFQRHFGKLKNEFWKHIRRTQRRHGQVAHITKDLR